MIIEEKSTLNNILNCAKNEFLDKGFENASLRNIAKQAGVTTGAIYGHFKDKDAMFVELVKDGASGMADLIEKLENNDHEFNLSQDADICSLVNVSKEIHRQYVEYVYNNFDTAKLIILCSGGSSMGNWVDEMIDHVTKINLELMKKEKHRGGKEISELTLHTLVEFYFKSVTELVKHNVSYEEALKHIDSISTFFFAGWNQLLKME